MKKLEISISKAQLTGFSVTFTEDGMPDVGANIALLTEEDKHVTDFHISTNSWNDETKFDLPLEMIDPIKKIAIALEHIIVEHIRDSQYKLKSGNNK